MSLREGLFWTYGSIYGWLLSERLIVILSSDCCSSVILLEGLAGICFIGVSLVVSVKAVSIGVRFLCRDMEDTWRGRGSEKGLVVMLQMGGEGSYCGELSRVGLDVGALGRVS